MRTARAIGACLVVLAAAASVAGAESRELDGTVIETRSRWGYGGDLIVTESVLEQPDGTRVTLHQLGGRVGDVVTVVTHHPPLLAAGERVRIRVTDAVAATGRRWLRVTEVLEASRLPEGSTGFVRTTTGAQTPLFFAPGCAVLATNAAGAETVPGQLELQAVARVITNWNLALESCSEFSLQHLGAIDLEPALDGINVIRFREDRWCRPAVGVDPEVCHDPAAAGLTFLTFGLSGDRNGEILDADIEINGVDFGLVVDGEGRTHTCVADIENTLTHEIGHLLGLDHTCYDGIGPRPVDHTGEPVPSCFPERQLPSEITEPTMYNFQDCGETKKASLEPDDVAGACAIYEGAGGECTYPSFGGGFLTAGCTAAGGGPAGSGALWALFALTALACSRTRRR